MASRILRAALAWLLPAVYIFLERLVPKSSTCVFISFPDVADNALALFDFVERESSGSINLAWLVQDVDLARARLNDLVGIRHGARRSVVKKNSIRGLWVFLRSKRVFFTHGHYWFVRSNNQGKLINLWHGMPIKAIGRRDVRFASSFHATDKTIASSSFFRAVMADAFALSVNDVMVTGLPRCDRLVKPTARAVALREALVRDYDRFVIWMPTYRFSSLGQSRNDGDCSMDDYVAGFRSSLRDLSRMAVKKHVLVVVKLHPMDFLNDQELDELPGVNLLRSNDRLFASVDPYELLSVSDGLITDVSSVCFDYMVTSKPILITRDALASYRRALVFDLELLFEVVETTESLAMSDRFFDDVLVGERASGGADNCFYDSDLTDASLAVWQAFGLEDEKPRIALAG